MKGCGQLCLQPLYTWDRAPSLLHGRLVGLVVSLDAMEKTVLRYQESNPGLHPRRLSTYHLSYSDPSGMISCEKSILVYVSLQMECIFSGGGSSNGIGSIDRRQLIGVEQHSGHVHFLHSLVWLRPIAIFIPSLQNPPKRRRSECYMHGSAIHTRGAEELHTLIHVSET